VGGTMQATYDGLGRCVRRTVGGVTKLFTYDDWKPFLEWDGAGNWMAWNIYGAEPDEILARYDVFGRVSIYKQDQHGNVPAVLDQFGNVVEKYTYDAFGKPTVFDAYGNVLSQSAVGNRFMYTGREWIPELGIYDYRHRMYHPGLGRFLQSDPTGFDAGDMNLFRYCDDDPVDRSDPTGLYSKSEGWDDKKWPQYDAAQQRMANNVDKAAEKIDRKVFEKVFGPNSATPKNWATVQSLMRKIAERLRSHSKQYPAVARTGAYFAKQGWGALLGMPSLMVEALTLM